MSGSGEWIFAEEKSLTDDLLFYRPIQKGRQVKLRQIKEGEKTR